jgi:catechol 2,3-dioxygenase-like lactoylglutathione lyase family enzyme
MTARIPGLTGIEHVGLTVPDIDVATSFFSEILGAETLYDIGPFPDVQDWMATHLAGRPGAHLHRMRVLRLGNGPVVELIQFTTTSAADAIAPPNGVHIAFYVDDMEKALHAVRSLGLAIQSGPVHMTEGPSAGLTWLYFSAPWGLQLELVSYPGGIAAYKALSTNVWRPR